MRLEQQIGRDRRFDLVRRELRESGLRVLTNIGVGPAVEPALLDADQIIGGQIVAEPVALLNHRPELAGLRVEGERGRVARAGGDGHLIGAVSVEALDRRFGLRLDAEIARRADTDIERTGFRVDRQMPVLVPHGYAEDALLSQHLSAVGARYRLALGRGRHADPLRRLRPSLSDRSSVPAGRWGRCGSDARSRARPGNSAPILPS